MAFCDYHACDHCGQNKTFYDASLDGDLDPETGDWMYGRSASMIEGVPAYPGHRAYALCFDCQKTHEIKIVERKDQ